VDALGGLALPLLFLVVLYLLLIRPQQRRQKQHRQLVSNLAVGDDVVTIGGVHGRVIELGDDTMDLQVTADEDVVIRFQRSALARVIQSEPGTE
jgi:preprotein translocase subunit YajC